MIKAIWISALSVAAVAPAAAEIQDYMVRRLIYLSTSCGLQQLDALPRSKQGHQRFQGHCADVASYPDGLVVECSDDLDDRSCKVTTPAKSFDSLKLLQNK